jgi:hypothetical protein
MSFIRSAWLARVQVPDAVRTSDKALFNMAFILSHNFSYVHPFAALPRLAQFYLFFSLTLPYNCLNSLD